MAIPHTHLFKEPGLAGSTALRAGYLVPLGLVTTDLVPRVGPFLPARLKVAPNGVVTSHPRRERQPSRND